MSPREVPQPPLYPHTMQLDASTFIHPDTEFHSGDGKICHAVLQHFTTICICCLDPCSIPAHPLCFQFITTSCCAGAAAALAPSDAQQPQVVLTRERGKNGQLIRALKQRGIRVLEMPLVETMPGPDRDSLPEVLRQGGLDWVVVTSPEAAAVFLRGWESAGRPQVPSPQPGGIHHSLFATPSNLLCDLGTSSPHQPLHDRPCRLWISELHTRIQGQHCSQALVAGMNKCKWHLPQLLSRSIL